jgi:predicted nuclease of restriction endonuclease-like (RecB) superfamily
MNTNPPDDIYLFSKIAELIELARKQVVTAVNLAMVRTYYEIGRTIIDDEQAGNERAEYGKAILKGLSRKLTEKFGKGFSEDNLSNMRQFYLTYSISETLSRKFTLSWSHYLILMRIRNPDQRSFYEREAAASHWSLRELQRQLDSALYERLALSRNTRQIRQLASKGQLVQRPVDVLKDPYVLEFLSLKEDVSYSESELETRIIHHLQQFLLELGKGFTFVGRQVRFTFEESHFRVDLVLYNRLLQCFVLVDLKIGKLTHQDLGQMQMYVNYYDRFEKEAHEKPTIGILLCQQKNDALVELTLPKEATIYASEYSLYLPDKQLLQQKLAEWMLESDQSEARPA